MGSRTKIDWCDATWNPVTGCLHGCEYCYARRIAERFKGWDGGDDGNEFVLSGNGLHSVMVCNKPQKKTDGSSAPYPMGFCPTFHRYRLDEPQKWKMPRSIFVSSMGDLFGDWVPMDWKIEVLQACAKAPQHRYLFLTKNPMGYALWPTEKHTVDEFDKTGNPYELYTENMWFGVTYTGQERLPHQAFDPKDWKSQMSIGTNFWYLWRMSGAIFPFTRNKFLSIEPISCDITEVEDERNPGKKLLEKFIYGENRPFRTEGIFKWVIVGAETGNRKGRVYAKKEWIDKLAALCDRSGVPIFMKDSLRGLMGKSFRQEFPWEAKT